MRPNVPAMPNEPYFPVYRAARGLRGAGVAVAAPVMLLGYLSLAGAPGTVLLTWTVIVLVLFPLLFVALRRSRTVTHPEHIEIRQPFGTRRIPWREIRAIEITGSRATGRYVLVREGSGRRRGLPHVNSRALGDSLDAEVRRLYALWEWLR